MFKLSKRLPKKARIQAETGAVSLEYGLIASLIAVAAITGLTPLGNNLGTSFKAAADAILVGPTVGPPPPAAAPPTAAPIVAPPRTPAP